MTTATTEQEAAVVAIVEKVARMTHGWTKDGASEDEVVRIARLAAVGALAEVKSPCCGATNAPCATPPGLVYETVTGCEKCGHPEVLPREDVGAMTTTTLTLTDFILARVGEDEAAARAATGDHWEAERHAESYGGDEPVERWSVTTDQRMIAPSGSEMAINADAVTVDYDRDYSLPEGGCGRREDAAHIARHDPARVLAECEAKRRIVEECSGGMRDADVMPYDGGSDLAGSVLSALAAVYADHPDYREEWRP